MTIEHTLPDGQVIKVVPESDLMALKTGAETKEKELSDQVTTLQTQVVEANRVKEEKHNALVQAQANTTQLEATLKEYEAAKANAEELQTKLTTVEASVSGLNTKLLDQKKQLLTTAYTVGANTLEGKTLEQLETLEEALKLVGKPAKPATTVDLGGGGAAVPPTSALEASLAEIAAIREKSK